MPSRPPRIATPVLRDTLYDRVSSWAISLFAGIAVFFLFVVAVWITNRLPAPKTTIPVEIVDMPGGAEDGSPDETLRVDSPEPERADAAPAEVPSNTTEVAEALDSMVEISESATQVVQQQFDTGIQNSGKGGSAKGTGRRGLGIGPGTGGIPREQRWFVRFADRASVEEYAKQLDYFGIELGALLPDGRLAYLSKSTSPTPEVRYVKGGGGEQRMFMTWQGGDRRSADVELFKRAGVQVSDDATIFHFYSKNTEAILARLETDYRNRPTKKIRRTYFAVESEGKGYRFSVFKQIDIQ